MKAIRSNGASGILIFGYLVFSTTKWIHKKRERENKQNAKQEKQNKANKISKMKNSQKSKWNTEKNERRKQGAQRIHLRANEYFMKANSICHFSVIIKRASHIHYRRTHQFRITGITKLHLLNGRRCSVKSQIQGVKQQNSAWFMWRFDENVKLMRSTQWTSLFAQQMCMFLKQYHVVIEWPDFHVKNVLQLMINSVRLAYCVQNVCIGHPYGHADMTWERLPLDHDFSFLYSLFYLLALFSFFFGSPIFINQVEHAFNESISHR